MVSKQIHACTTLFLYFLLDYLYCLPSKVSWYFNCSMFRRSVDVIKSIWVRLRKEEPELLGSFEEFLARVTGDLKRSQTDLRSMEAVLQK